MTQVKMQLDEELKQELLNLIKKGKDIIMSFKNFLFPIKEEPKEILMGVRK